MNTDPLSVLIVDDSALMRNLIKKIVESDPELQCAGIAMNGRFALQKIPNLKPDILVLDLEMPEMNGLEFLKEREKQGITIPVVILSAVATKGARVTMEALSLGASDFITKPGTGSADINQVADHLKHLLKAYGNDYRRREFGTTAYNKIRGLPDEKAAETPSAVFTPPKPAVPVSSKREWEEITPLRKTGHIEIIAIGISTGGPNALRKIFPDLDPGLKQPIVVVQHMPAGFTKEFAQSLNKICPLEVKEAEEGDILKPGRILIAPGDRHLQVEKKRLATIAHLNDQGTVNGHKPSAGVLFDSVSKEFSNNCMAVIMTGMGRDGSREIGGVLKEGGLTLAQDEKSCVVYGMPRVAVEHGYAQHIVPLNEMADKINSFSAQYSF